MADTKADLDNQSGSNQVRPEIQADLKNGMAGVGLDRIAEIIRTSGVLKDQGDQHLFGHDWSGDVWRYDIPVQQYKIKNVLSEVDPSWTEEHQRKSLVDRRILSLFGIKFPQDDKDNDYYYVNELADFARERQRIDVAERIERKDIPPQEFLARTIRFHPNIEHFYIEKLAGITAETLGAVWGKKGTSISVEETMEAAANIYRLMTRLEMCAYIWAKHHRSMDIEEPLTKLRDTTAFNTLISCPTTEHLAVHLPCCNQKDKSLVAGMTLSLMRQFTIPEGASDVQQFNALLYCLQIALDQFVKNKQEKP